MGTRFEKDAKHLEYRIARTVEKERWAKSQALFCTTSVSGTANYPFHTSRSSLLSHFAGGAEIRPVVQSQSMMELFTYTNPRALRSFTWQGRG